MNYKEQISHPRWQKKRLRILQRDNWSCQLCGDTETTLHVHHKSYFKKAWDANDSDLITYCEACHSLVEDDRLMIVTKVIKRKQKNKDSIIYATVIDTKEKRYFILICTFNSTTRTFTNRQFIFRNEYDILKQLIHHQNGKQIS